MRKRNQRDFLENLFHFLPAAIIVLATGEHGLPLDGLSFAFPHLFRSAGNRCFTGVFGNTNVVIHFLFVNFGLGRAFLKGLLCSGVRVCFSVTLCY